MKKISENSIRLPVVIGLLMLFAYYMQAQKWSESGCLGNIKIYVLSAALFFIVVGAVALFFAMVGQKKIFEVSDTAEKIFSLIMILVGGWFLVRCYHNEIDRYAYPAAYFRHIIPGWIYVLILTVVVAMAYCIIRKVSGRGCLLRCGFSILIAFIQGWFLYAPNPFGDDLGGIYDIDAYTNSIINTLAYAPFEMYSSSTYGHHGLLFLIPIKIFHQFGFTYWVAISIVIGIFGFITFFAEYWCISQMVKNDMIYIIAVLANAVVSFQVYSNQYYQMMPHRYLFQAIVLSGCILAFRKPSSAKFRILMWSLTGLAMVWNIETGIVVTIVWYIGAVYLDGKEKKSYSFRMIFLNGCYAIAAFLGGFGLVNLYNLAVGGNIISISTFIYPIGSQSFPIDMLELTLMKPDNGYFMVIALMLGIIGFYFFESVYIRLNERKYTAFLAAVMGLGVFTYYMNCAVTTNATIVCFSMVILLAYLCDRFVPFAGAKKENGKIKRWRVLVDFAKVESVVGAFCLIILSGLALASVSTAGATLKYKTITAWDTEALSEFLIEAKEKIPGDAVAFGKYTPQLYALLDRKSGIYIAEWENMGTSWANTIMNQEAFDKLNDILTSNKYKHVVVNSEESGYLPENCYEKIKSMEYNGYIFEVYERK